MLQTHLLLHLLLLLLPFSFISNAIDIGIGIGIGGGSPSPSNPSPGCPLPPPPPPPLCPTPSPPPPPPPPPPPRPSPKGLIFENELQKRAYYVIQKFKKTITCDPFHITKTWNGSKVCNYCGFFCETPPNRKKTPTIASVDFNGYHLQAKTVVGFVDQLPDLAIFHANSNNFSGSSPPLKYLQFFYELDFSNNKLTGPFPSNLLNLFNLTFLDLRFNFFTGEVPPPAFNLNVSILFLNNNHFSGNIPANLGDTKAVYLTFANNNFTGPIPPSIGRTSGTLLQVLFLNNKLSGCLPSEIGLLKKTTIFDAGNNCITGPIPLSFGCLRCMQELNFANNRLYGQVPDELCVLPKISNLSLSGNYFTSLGKSCWMLVKKKVLDVKKNCIPWLPDQRTKEECDKFFAKPKTYCPLIKDIPCKWPLDGDRESTADDDDQMLSSTAGDGRSRRLFSLPNVYETLRAR